MRKFLSEVLLGASVLLFASSPGHGGTAEWLKAHKEYRCMHGVPPLWWSKDLAKLAEETANNPHVCVHGTHGLAENIYCGISTEQVVVDDWYSEKNNYDYNNPIWSADTGHFINVVAKGLTEVGCTCTDRECVCVYGGNYDSTPAGLTQNVLKPISTKEACNPPGKNARYINGMWVVALGWSEETSEELPPVEASDGALISGVRCRHDYCDNVSLKLTGVIGVKHGLWTWTDYFSEEGKAAGRNRGTCEGSNEFMTGIKCKHDYCDNISILCTQIEGTLPEWSPPYNPPYNKTGDCYETAFFSEEGGGTMTLLGPPYFATGLICEHDYCDNMSIRYCRLERNPG